MNLQPGSVEWWRPAQILPLERRKRALRKRDEWSRSIDPSYLFHRLFDFLPGVHFFAKNLKGECMFASRGILELYGFVEESQIVGLTDFDLAPAQMAEAYAQDDAKIIDSGEPLLNRVELWFDQGRVPAWYVVNKLPIRAVSGDVIGIMGILQSYESRQKLLRPFGGISKAVELIQSKFAEKIGIDDLAQQAGISARQVERKFKAAFGLGPHEFLIRTRILAAYRMLRETEASLIDVALGCGFCDESALVRQFRKHFGLTPGAFRRRMSR